MTTLAKSSMPATEPNAILTNIALAAAGGYADAASYLLAGSFTGHLTGNTVLAAISLRTGEWHRLVYPLLAVALFACGTACGLMLERLRSRNIQPLLVALPLELILIACASTSETFGVASAKTVLLASLCLALGLQNGVFRKTDGVSVHATYVTGDVTSLLASMVSTERGKQEKALSFKVLGSTWLSFLAGALLSALMIHRFGPRALWFLELPISLAVVMAWKSSASHSSTRESRTPPE